MTDKQLIIKKVLEHSVKLLKTDYSRTYRYDYFAPKDGKKGGSFDCSSYVAACFNAAGFPLLTSAGKELITSNIQVDAVGFDLIYPKNKNDIGKVLPTSTSLIPSLKVQPGDIVFFNWGTTSRKNKITHVAIVYDKNYYIHTGNNKDKCTKVPLTYGNRRICAVIRLKDSVSLKQPPELKSGSSNRVNVRRAQTLLNVTSIHPRLRCDGQFGTLTSNALKQYQGSVKLPVTGIVDAATWEKLSPTNKQEEMDVLKQGDKNIDVYLFQRAALKAGYKLLKPGKQWADMFEKDAAGKPIINGCDGSFGSWTVEVVKQIQAKHQLPQTGIVDYTTYGKLASEIKTGDAALLKELTDKNTALTKENGTLKTTNGTYKTAIDGAKGFLNKV